MRHNRGMNENMAAKSHVLIEFLQIYLVFLNLFYVVTAKKCADVECRVPISTARAVDDHEAIGEHYISFKKGDSITIYGKHVGMDDSIWEGSVGGAAAGFFRSDFVEERTKFADEDKLVYVASKDESNLKAAENEELHGESNLREDEIKARQIRDDDQADSLEDINGSPPGKPSSEESNQAGDKHPVNNYKDDTDTELRQDKIAHENENSDENNMDYRSLDNEDNDPQTAVQNNDKDKNMRNEKIEVYTDPNGVQYDISVEYRYLPLEDKDNDEDVKLVEEDHQKQSAVDDPDKLDDLKENGDLNQGMPGVGDEKETAEKRKEGFFSSVRHLVSDFTENIIKDFSGEDQEKGKAMKGNKEQDQGTEDHERNDKPEREAEQRESVEVDNGEEESNVKTSELEVFQESVQQLNEEQLETTSESIAAGMNEVKVSSIDEEELLKEKAKRVVEDISGVVKVSKEEDEKSKVTVDDLKNENTLTTSQESNGSSQLSSKKYSDKVLCSSVAIEDRDVCMDSGSKEECLLDNCCFDETAEPGKRCFFKPSSPESDITEEDLLSGENEDMSKENNDEAVTAGEDNLESSEPVSPNISEQPGQTVDVASKRNGIELDSGRKSDIIDKNDDEIEALSDQSSEQIASSPVENTPSANAHTIESSGERNESPEEKSSEKSPTVEAVDDSASRKPSEVAKDIDEREVVKDSIPSDYVDIVEEVEKNMSETDEVDKHLKTGAFGRDDSSSDVKANLDVQKSADVEVRNEKLRDESNDDSTSDKEPSASSYSASVENQDPLTKDTTEEGDLDSQVSDRKSDQGLDDDSSLDQNSSTEKDVRDIKEQEISSYTGPKDTDEAIGVDDESVEKTVELEPKDSLKNESVDISGETVKSDVAKSDDTGPENESYSSEERTTRGSVSKENEEDYSQQESSKADTTAIEDRIEETTSSRQDSRGNVPTSEASVLKDVSEENQEGHSEDQSTEKRADSTVDVEGILDKIKNLLPGGGRKEDPKSKDQESLKDVKDSKEDVTSLNETSADSSGGKRTYKEDSRDNVPNSEVSLHEDVSEDQSNEAKADSTVDVEGILDKIKNFLPGGGAKENTKSRDQESKEGEHVVKSDPIQKANEANLNETSADFVRGQGTDEDLDRGEVTTKNILAEFLEEESFKTKDSDSIIPEIKDEGGDEDKRVESGSTHFSSTAEPTLPVEKTLDKELVVNDSSSQESEETRTEIENTVSGMEQNGTEIEETKAGLGGIETGVKETITGTNPDIIPTKTTTFESSETINTGQRPFEKKFPNIASKWIKNKQMNGKKTLEKKKDMTEETLARSDDPLSGTCAKDGSCERVNTFSSRAILENYDISDHDDDDDIVEPSPEKTDEDKQPELKSFKTQFLETLAVAVRKFREYHTVVASYGLQMLKPVMNIVKLLGKQMGLEETIDYMEHEVRQGPQGVIALTLIMIAFIAYCMLNILCRKKVPPSYGPNLKDIFKTYEGRIRILEEECQSYDEKINNLKNKADEDVQSNSALEKQLDDEKHERRKSEEQISILKEIVKNLNEKVDLWKEESSSLKQSLDEKSERINSMEEQVSVKSKEIDKTQEKIIQLEALLKEKDDEKYILNENIEEYKKQLSKAEDDTDRHKTMLQDWNDRYRELQQKYDDISVSNQTLEEQIHFKDNEIEILRDSLVQINSQVHINSDEELSQEEVQEARCNKIKELMDVSQVRTDYKLCKEEKEKLENDMKQEVDRREKLEGEVEQLEIDLAKSKASEEEIRFKYREADIKLNALQDYFKNMESDLHRKLTAEEAARMASESELERKLREASTAVQDVELYRKQVEELRKEIDETQQAFRSQISSTEDRAHENWLKFRAAERELEEMKRERDALRRRLYDLETSAKPLAGLDDVGSTTTTDNLDLPVTRSESPAASIRSSKRNNSNPRKSPSGSTMDERKERVRRKPRDRNSPPSWDSDMGPPPRRRDKDRETPPPPPPLWDPNMGVSPRRKGRRDSPNLPNTGDTDMQRRRKERYTPSPPPPDSMIPSPRRPRDRPSPSSSPPPPPPAMLLPRGVRFPVERPPQPFMMGAPPPRMSSPFTRPPPPPDMMAPQPIGSGMNKVPLKRTPPQGFMRRGGSSEFGPRGPPPSANTDITPTGNTRHTGGNINLGTPSPPTTISPLRGVPLQEGDHNEQSSSYVNSGLVNNVPGEDEPPPAFARNGPYGRTPPGKIQTLPS